MVVLANQGLNSYNKRYPYLVLDNTCEKRKRKYLDGIKENEAFE